MRGTWYSRSRVLPPCCRLARLRLCPWVNGRAHLTWALALQVSRRLARRITKELRHQKYGYVKLAVRAYMHLLETLNDEDSSLFAKELVVQPVVRPQAGRTSPPFPTNAVGTGAQTIDSRATPACRTSLVAGTHVCLLQPAGLQLLASLVRPAPGP